MDITAIEQMLRINDAMGFLAGRSLLAVPLTGWAGAGLAWLGAWCMARLGLRILRPIIANNLRLHDATGRPVADNLVRQLRWITLFAALYCGFSVLNAYWKLDATRLVGTIAIILLFRVIWLFTGQVNLLTRRLGDVFPIALTNWINTLIRWMVMLLGAVAVLDVWGIQIGPVLASLGLFGVAVALGAQNLFRNLIGGLLILGEKRFTIGDIIQTGDGLTAVVEAIGFRSTLLRRFDSTPVFVSNDQLADGIIENLSGRESLRINWRIGLEYGTSAQQLRTIRDRIAAVIDGDAQFQPSESLKNEIRIEGFSASSIDIMVRCDTVEADFRMKLDKQEQLVLAIMHIVEEEGASFAFPSQTLYLKRENPPGYRPEHT